MRKKWDWSDFEHGGADPLGLPVNVRAQRRMCRPVGGDHRKASVPLMSTDFN